jgi:DnaK suppressor protein
MSNRGTGGSGTDAALGVLRVKRDEVVAEMAGLTHPAPDAGGISFGKRVGDGTSIAVERITQVAAHDRLQALLAEVERAEVKVADGSYGRCDACGDSIAPARIEARPWSTHCVGCA